MITFLVVCPLVFLAGFIDAIAGGGGLISLPAYLIVGLPAHNAIATNKLSSTMGTALTTVRYARSGYIHLKQALPGIAGAIIGSTVGARLNLISSDFYLKIFLLFVLPVAAFYVLKTKKLTDEQAPLSAKKETALIVIIALVVGCYDGFYGPGTGTFLILLLTGIGHLPIFQANGVCKAINLSTNAASLVVYLFSGKVLLVLGLTAGLFNIAGNYLGSACFQKGSTKFVKPVILIVLCIFFVKVLTSFL